MKNFSSIVNDLISELLELGSSEFSYNGLNIKSSLEGSCLKVQATYDGSEEDKAQKLIDNFETFVNSLSDDFFLEVTEAFQPGELKVIQDKLDSKDIIQVSEGINAFMLNLEEVASKKIKSIDADIEANRKELEELEDLKASYLHVLNKKF